MLARAGVQTVFLLQMAGRPGSGKSDLARAIGAERRAVVVDNDVIKSNLLDTGIAWDEAGPAAWELAFALADDFLGQGANVVLDNPGHYPSVPVRGCQIALAHGASYGLIECRCPDDAEVERRLRERVRLRSQMTGLDELSPDATSESAAVRVGDHDWMIYHPDDAPWTAIDTCRPLSDIIGDALVFVDRFAAPAR